jgi:hypothetical protein
MLTLLGLGFHDGLQLQKFGSKNCGAYEMVGAGQYVNMNREPIFVYTKQLYISSKCSRDT